MERIRADGLPEMKIPGTIIVSLFVSLWLWILPATFAAGVIAAFAAITGPWPWYVWIILSPTLYLVWLILFLYFCAPFVRRMGRRHPKPRLATGTDRKLATVLLCTLRLRLVTNLPLVPVLEHSGWGRKLVFRSYSPSVNIGKGVGIAGRLTDPDLTTVEDFVTIGKGAVISAHVFMHTQSGRRVYVSAPVKICRHAFVGGGAVVTPGCIIGENAVIMPFSVLKPHTIIPAEEIWGGSPACFQKKRGEKDAVDTEKTGSPESGSLNGVRT
jgi:acetyltransferase-like isoleucine patch superfamily enzyme